METIAQSPAMLLALLALLGFISFFVMSPKGESTHAPRLRDDPTYGKYFAIMRAGVHHEYVRQKMLIDGVNTQALELGPDAYVSQLVEDVQ